MSVGRTLVVGVGSDIGAAVAKDLASSDTVLELWGFDPDRLTLAVERCERAGARVTGRVVDVRDAQQVSSAVEALRGAPLRRAVWTPAVFDWASAVDADPDRWVEVIDVGLAAAARWAAHVAPLLAAAAPSRLLLLGSLAGRTVFPHNAAYVASKHGLDALGRALWEDLSPLGVAVTVLSPSVVDASAGRLAPGPKLRVADVVDAVRWTLDRPAHVAIRELVITALPHGDVGRQP